MCEEDIDSEPEIEKSQYVSEEEDDIDEEKKEVKQPSQKRNIQLFK